MLLGIMLEVHGLRSWWREIFSACEGSPDPDMHKAAEPQPKRAYVLREHGFFMYISSDAEIRGGDACICGTRIPVTFILDGIAEGTPREEIPHSDPSPRPEHIDTALASLWQTSPDASIAVSKNAVLFTSADNDRVENPGYGLKQAGPHGRAWFLDQCRLGSRRKPGGPPTTRQATRSPALRKGPKLSGLLNGSPPSKQEEVVAAERAPEGYKNPMESFLERVSDADAPEVDGFAMGAAG